jgi:hypothetical protein
VAVMSSNDILRTQKLCGKEQPELTAFVLAFTSDLSPEAIGLALYAHVVVTEAFRRTKTPFRKIKAGKIERTWKDNFGFINELKQAGHTRKPFQIDASLSSEPGALQYVVEALTEPDEEDPVELDEHEFWHILQLLKTIVDCMHDAPREMNASPN